MKKLITHCSLLKSQRGQSLVEILIGLSVGALMIGASSIAITGILKSGTTVQYFQGATNFNQELLDRVRAFSNSSWYGLYHLTKGSTPYFLNASGTALTIIQGKEGMLDNNIVRGLVAHWKFDEATSTTATSTYDASGNNNTGNMTGGVTRATSTCKVSSCFSFDGTNDYVDAGDWAAVSALTKGTWTLWFKTSAAFTDYKGLLSKRWASPAGWEWELNTSGNKLYFEIDGGNGTANYINRSSTKTGAQLVDGNWHHVAVTWDGTWNATTGIHIYVDGALDDGTAGATGVSSSIGDSAATVKIGAQYDNISYTFDGHIDDVRIYDRALSSDEVKRLYASNIFSRYFYIDNVTRDSSGDIGSGTDDPATQKITAYSEWQAAGGTATNFNVTDYVTKWRNTVIHQSDWFGGSGGGTLTEANSKYTSSTNISTSTPGSIKIQGL